MSPAVVDLAALVQDFRSSFPSPASDDALALQREAADTSEYVCRECDEQSCVCDWYADMAKVSA